jgi:hypothetical protein
MMVARTPPLDDELLPEAAVGERRRDAALPEDAALRFRLDPEDVVLRFRVVPEDAVLRFRVVPEDAVLRFRVVAEERPEASEPAVRLACVPLDAAAVRGFREPLLVVALLPVAFRAAVFPPVCLRELLVVATRGPPFQDYSGATPWLRTDNRCNTQNS